MINWNVPWRWGEMGLFKLFLKACKAFADFVQTVFTIVVEGSDNEQTMTEVFMDLLRGFAADVLNLIPSDKPYRTKLFDALNLKRPTFAMEGVLLRENPEGGFLEVYLTQRSMKDTAYPGEFHAPGSGVRNGETWEAVAARLARDEYNAPVRQVTVLHEGGFFYPEPRGWYCSVPCLIELDGDPAVGQWYPVDQLPEKIVAHHRYNVIPVVVRYWNNRTAYDAAQSQMRAALGL